MRNLTELNGSGKFTEPPATILIAIASPSALPIPSTTPVIIPDFAAGIITGVLIFSLPALARDVYESITVVRNTIGVTIDGQKFDKDNFVKNLLLDNLLLVDIYSRSKKLRMPTEQKRTVMLIRATNNREMNVLELTKASFGNSAKEFITAVDEKDVIIIKDLGEHEGNQEIDRYAKTVCEQLAKDGVRGVRISYGTSVREIKDVSRSYKEAKMAIDVGKIFFEEQNIIAYSQLGIGRLIYQLPIPLCKMFIKEIFGGKSPDDFDEETLTTINKFFENSLNVSETSRQLFIHRNTLVYRLDKLQKSTGLDLRVFEDAITFKIALMVVRYMKYMESFEY